MRPGPRALGLAAILAAAGATPMGCAPEREVESGPASRVGDAVGPDTVAGPVRQAGNAPFTRVLIEGEETLAVTGRYERELARLVGAEVRVTGERTGAGGPGPSLRAVSYEILSVDGERPLVGVLREDEEGHYLETAAGEERLGALSPGLRRATGGRVWVILGEGRTVVRYGTLRPPEEMEERSGSA